MRAELMTVTPNHFHFPAADPQEKGTGGLPGSICANTYMPYLGIGPCKVITQIYSGAIVTELPCLRKLWQVQRVHRFICCQCSDYGTPSLLDIKVGTFSFVLPPLEVQMSLGKLNPHSCGLEIFCLACTSPIPIFPLTLPFPDFHCVTVPPSAWSRKPA
jgi:hypothetical protein